MPQTGNTCPLICVTQTRPANYRRSKKVFLWKPLPHVLPRENTSSRSRTLPRMGDFSNHYSEGMVVIRGVAILRIAASSILLMAKDLNLHERLISELGVVLQERRARLHMSQSDLAESSRFHRSYISDVERGARNISVKNLSRLALALDIPVSTILVQVEKRLSSKSGRARKRA